MAKKVYKTIYPHEMIAKQGTPVATLLDTYSKGLHVPNVVKEASCDEIKQAVDSLEPKDGYNYVHLISLGADEFYGPNTRGDAYNEKKIILRPEEPVPGADKIELDAGLDKYHNKTFMANGGVYRNHITILDGVEPEGQVIFATLNKKMHRGELIIELPTDLWKDDLDRLDQNKPIYFSVGCLVPGDYCSVCGNFSKPDDDKRCDHLKKHLREYTANGTQIKAYNDQPTFYDISRVVVPADKIAFGLVKVASDLSVNDLTMPTHILDKIENRSRADRVDIVDRLSRKEASAVKLVIPAVEDDPAGSELLSGIPKDDVGTVIYILHKRKTLLPPNLFFDLVGGQRRNQIKNLLPLIMEKLCGIFNNIQTSTDYRTFLDDSSYEGDSTKYFSSYERLLEPLLYKYSIEQAPLTLRIIKTASDRAVLKEASQLNRNSAADKAATFLAREYARYQVAFLAKNNTGFSTGAVLACNGVI